MLAWCRVPWALIALLLSTFGGLRPLAAGTSTCDDAEERSPACCALTAGRAVVPSALGIVIGVNPRPHVVRRADAGLVPATAPLLPVPGPRLGMARGPRAP